MHIRLHKLEVIVDKTIPWILLLLLVIIVGDIFFLEQIEKHGLHYWFMAGDWLVVIVFVADLIFKYMRVRKIPSFIKKYWLDILAVFPFILVFRLFEGVFSIYLAGETIQRSQAVLHEGIEIEREASKIAKETEMGAKIVREAESATKLSRTPYILRFFRMPRLFRYAYFFEKPSGKHYPHEKR